MPSKVIYSVEERLATIVLADPASRNAMSRELVEELNAALDSAFAARDVAALLITSEGIDFSAGGDLREMALLPTRSLAEIEAVGRPIAELFKRLAAAPKPVVAAVQGHALGGGCGLACAASITLAADDARLGCPELRLGLFPFLIMPALRRAIGDRRALDLALSARLVDAHEARSIGLVTRCVPRDALATEARALALRIAASSPDALDLGLRAFHESGDLAADLAIERNLALRTLCCKSPNLAEGARAFLERRTPRWDYGMLGSSQ